MNDPYKLSPIHSTFQALTAEFMDESGWRIPKVFSDVEAETTAARQSVVLSDQSANGKIRVEGVKAGSLLEAEALAVGAGKSVDGRQIYRLRPDLFYMRTSPSMVVETVGDVKAQIQESDDLITVTDVTHGRAELWLIGPASIDLLSRLCGLNFQDDQFPNSAVRQSSVAKTAQIIIRHDLGGLPAYGLIGPRSLAVYLWETIMEAGQDLNIQPIGMAALRNL